MTSFRKGGFMSSMTSVIQHQIPLKKLECFNFTAFKWNYSYEHSYDVFNLCNHIYSSPFLHVFHIYTSYKPCTHWLFSFSQHRWHFKRNFFVPQLTQTTKKLLLLNIACCWRVFWNYTPFFKGTEELRTSRAFTSMANTESSSADWMQLFTNQCLMVAAD